jgi:predicted AAA+ superfamily ATPase
MEAFWARDILELFRLERRDSFLKFAELLLAQSSGRFNAAAFATACGVSRPTIVNYLAILESTHLIWVVRPYSDGHPREIVSTPLVYGFDTGFVAWSQGLHEIPAKNKGFFWEHLVLNELKAGLQDEEILCWRDKQGREVDFVCRRRGKDPVAIEAKWSASAFDPAGMKAFRTLHSGSLNILVANDIQESYTREFGGLSVLFCPLGRLAESVG